MITKIMMAKVPCSLVGWLASVSMPLVSIDDKDKFAIAGVYGIVSL